jgi:hypothetical protein
MLNSLSDYGTGTAATTCGSLMLPVQFGDVAAGSGAGSSAFNVS